MLRVDDHVAPGTLLENRVSISSSDPSLPANGTSVFTTVGSAAIRVASLRVGRPTRDALDLRADLARAGLETPLDAPPPDVDLSDGFRLRVGAVGGPPLLDVSLGFPDLKCNRWPPDPARTTRCRIRDRELVSGVGLRRLDVTLRPYLSSQRNNARVAVSAKQMSIPESTGLDLEIVLEAAGEIYSDRVCLVPKRDGRLRAYARPQSKGP